MLSFTILPDALGVSLDSEVFTGIDISEKIKKVCNDLNDRDEKDADIDLSFLPKISATDSDIAPYYNLLLVMMEHAALRAALFNGQELRDDAKAKDVKKYYDCEANLGGFQFPKIENPNQFNMLSLFTLLDFLLRKKEELQITNMQKHRLQKTSALLFKEMVPLSLLPPRFQKDDAFNDMVEDA